MRQRWRQSAHLGVLRQGKGNGQREEHEGNGVATLLESHARAAEAKERALLALAVVQHHFDKIVEVLRRAAKCASYF